MQKISVRNQINFIIYLYKHLVIQTGMMNAPTIQFISETIEVMNKHYPRRMGQLFVINVSSIVFWFWDLISMVESLFN